MQERVVGEGIGPRNGAEEGERQREASVGGVPGEHGVVGGGGAAGHRGEEALGVWNAARTHVRRDGLVAPDHLRIGLAGNAGVGRGGRPPVASLPRGGAEMAGREHGGFSNCGCDLCAYNCYRACSKL